MIKKKILNYYKIKNNIFNSYMYILKNEYDIKFDYVILIVISAHI